MIRLTTLILLLLVLTFPTFAQPTLTTIADTIRLPDNTGASGTMYIRLSHPCTASDGSYIYPGYPGRVTVTSGVLSQALVPNDNCGSNDTVYRVRYELTDGAGMAMPRNDETWYVTTSGSPLTISTVVTTVWAGAAPSTIGLSSITGWGTKGRLIGDTGTSFGLFGPCANDELAIADSGETSGWACGSAGGTDDQTAAEVPFTPAGSIVATDTQAAVEEVSGDADGHSSAVITFTNKTLNDLSNNIDADGLHAAVRNSSGIQIDLGRVVYVSGYNIGLDLVEVDLADADDAAKMPALCMIEANIANNATGHCVISGKVSGVDTSGATVGDGIYVDTTAGAFTTTRPTGAAEEVQRIGLVTRVHASLGIIELIGAGRVNDIPNDVGADDIGNKDVDDTELSYVDGVTSPLQAQLDAKSALHPLPAGTIIGEDEEQFGNYYFDGYTAASAAARSIIRLRRARGTISSPAATVDGDSTGSYNTARHNGSSFESNTVTQGLYDSTTGGYTKFWHYDTADAGIVPLTLYTWGAAVLGKFAFGGTTSSYPALKRSTTELQVRLADDSGYGGMDAVGYKVSGGAISGNDIANVAAGDIIATDVQAAITELDDEKESVGGAHPTGGSEEILGEEESETGGGRWFFDSYGSVSAEQRSGVRLRRARNTKASPTAVADGDNIGTFETDRYNGSAFETNTQTYHYYDTTDGAYTQFWHWTAADGAVLPFELTTTGVIAHMVLDLEDPGTQPTCDSSTRGQLWYDEGGAGVADTLDVCAKDAGDAYAWVPQGEGGGYNTIDDEDTPLTQRTTLNFEGAGVTCADDTDQTTCTIAGTGGTTHDILSATHTDSVAAGVSRGSLIVGTVTPKWEELVVGGANTFFTSDGTDAAWGTATLASAQFVNQGTTTTLLHGNGAGNPSWGAVSLTADVSGILPSTGGGTGNGFTKFTGPTTTEKAFALPDANATLLYSGGALGTPSGGTLTNADGLPVSTGISGLGTGVATWLATPSSANLASAVTNETGTTLAVFNTGPSIVGATITGVVDAGGASFEIPNSASLPGTCTVGDQYMDTDATSGQRFYLCETTNNWILQGDGGGSAYATVDDEDTPLTQRTTLNFAGAGVACADDTDQTTCTIAGGGSTHEILSATHTDSTTATVSRGSLVVGKTATPVWEELVVGGANTLLVSNGTDATWGAAVLASAQFVNQGTTTTILHGNAAGNPSWGAVSLTADVSGILPSTGGGTGNGFTAFTGPTTVEKTFTLPDSNQTIETQNNKGAVSGYASLDGSSLVVENPANATATPTASKIVVAEGDGDLNAGWIGQDQSYTWTGTHDFGGALFEVQNGIAAPLSTDCDADAEKGRLYQKTDATTGQQLYACEGLANGWVQQGDGGGGGYNTIDDEDTPLTQRTTLNFAGAGVTCADDTDQTTCTITSGGSGLAGYYETTAGTSIVATVEEHSFTVEVIGVFCKDTGTGAELKPSKIDYDTPTTDDVTVTFATAGSYGCMFDGSGAAGDVTAAAALTADLPVFGDGADAVKVGTKTGTGNEAVMSQSPIVVTPTIADFTNASTDHVDAAGGGTLVLAGAAFPNQGTTTTLLHGNGAGNPTWSAVSLTADVSGILPSTGGGTGLASGTSGGVLYFSSTTTIASSTLLTDEELMKGGGAGAAPEASGVTVTEAITHSKSLTLFDPVTGDDGRVQFQLPTGSTITRVACSVKAATSVDINLEKRAEATPDTAGTDALSAELVCDTGTRTSCAAGCDVNTISSAAIGADAPVALMISAVTGTPDTLRVHITYTVD